VAKILGQINLSQTGFEYNKSCILSILKWPSKAIPHCDILRFAFELNLQVLQERYLWPEKASLIG